MWQSLAAGRTREKLQQHGIKARKALGQNFLTDDQGAGSLCSGDNQAAGGHVLRTSAPLCPQSCNASCARAASRRAMR